MSWFRNEAGLGQARIDALGLCHTPEEYAAMVAEAKAAYRARHPRKVPPKRRA